MLLYVGLELCLASELAQLIESFPIDLPQNVDMLTRTIVSIVVIVQHIEVPQTRRLTLLAFRQ